MSKWDVTCWSCGTVSEFAEKFGRTEECPKCLEDLHSCRNCVFYDASVSGSCREPQASWVNRKEAANFCDYLKPAATGGSAADDKSDAMSKLNDLFK